jgi:hypothetical protein
MNASWNVYCYKREMLVVTYDVARLEMFAHRLVFLLRWDSSTSSIFSHLLQILRCSRCSPRYLGQ